MKKHHKRNDKIANCEFCKKEFTSQTNIHGRQRFCSRKCASSSLRKRVEFECDNCGVKFERTPSKAKNSKKGFRFCSRKCKDESQSLSGNLPQMWPDHYGKGERSYRLSMKKEIEKGCSACCVEKDPWLIVVHHIDGDKRNNKKSNLEVLCANCHCARHLKLIKGKWVFDFKALTPRNVVKKIDKARREKYGVCK